MIVTAWNNGKKLESGGGYGLKLSVEDRDTYFSKDWDFVEINLPEDVVPVSVNINKESFWGSTCRELIHRKIGIWLRENKLAPWPKNFPPKFRLSKVTGNKFKLERT
jgi:hypothetical protein